MKHGGTWNFLASMLRMKRPKFEKVVINVINSTVEILYKECVAQVPSRYPMSHLRECGTSFHHFPYARHATDVIFKQSSKPLRTIDKTRVWYSKNHELFGYKVEVSVLPIGLALNCNSHARCKMSDIKMF